MAQVKEGQKIKGPKGLATELIYKLEASDEPAHQASVAMWFLDCPGQTPAWRNYMLSTVHLRPIEGVKPAVITRPGSTHEILLIALDPARDPITTNPESWGWLRPLNFVRQIRLNSDEHAKDVLTYLAARVVQGYLWAEPPLSGQVEPWESHIRGIEESGKL